MSQNYRQIKCPSGSRPRLPNPLPSSTAIQETYDIALKNLKTLEDAGIPIAAGTDAGNIGTIHGPALFQNSN